MPQSAENLQTATVSFNSIPVRENNGLSTYISAEYQPVNLSRGATPAGCSYTTKRIPVNRVGATAGCDEDKIYASYDDNELSEWGNDGNMQTAWIRYELEHDATINEVELKLASWRNRGYPIRIFVDDEKVFEGETAKSLGYVSLPVKPTKGRFVKIQLTGKNSEGDAFGGIVEVTGKKEIEDPDKNTKGDLRIVEVEIYEEK